MSIFGFRVIPGGIGGVSPFLDLNDTPSGYSGEGNNLVGVGGAEDELEFVVPGVGADIDEFVKLTDTPPDYSGTAEGDIVTVNATTDGLEFTTPVPDAFTGLTDTPATYSGEAGKVATVNGAENALEFLAPVGSFSVVTITATSLNLVVSDNLKFFVMDNVAAQTIDIPDNSAEAFPIGAEMEFLRENATGTVTFDAPGAATLQSRDGLLSVNAQYSAVTLKKVGIDDWRLIGDLA